MVIVGYAELMKASRSATHPRRQAMAKRSMFVGLDVHKESIDISLAEEGRDGEVRHYGGITGDLEARAKVVKALRAPTRRLRFVYEAGPCGFGIHRYLTAQRQVSAAAAHDHTGRRRLQTLLGCAIRNSVTVLSRRAGRWEHGPSGGLAPAPPT